jgi:uncharacterized peroxidase-related enzyme
LSKQGGLSILLVGLASTAPCHGAISFSAIKPKEQTMSRLSPIDPASAEGKAKALLAGVAKALGMVPNVMRTAAHSPAALQAYLGFGRALGGGSLDAATREAIALTVAGENGCDYCASAHTAAGTGLGVAAEELAANLAGRSSDPRLAAILVFARAVVASRGRVHDDQLRAVRVAGVGDAEIVEIVAAVAANIFTNYLNQVAETEVDFPLVEAGVSRAA